MALTVFKIIFLIAFFVGVVVIIAAPLFTEKSARDTKQGNHHTSKIRLIGMIIASASMLIVLLLGAFK